jgi:hypothetical protein
VVAGTAFWYVKRIFGGGTKTYLRVFAASVIVFIAGYAIFLTSRDIQLTPAGMGNRVNIVAAAGVAMTLVSAGGMSSLLCSERYRSLVFAFLVSAFSFCACFVTNGIASYWVAASHQAGDNVAFRRYLSLRRSRAGFRELSGFHRRSYRAISQPFAERGCSEESDKVFAGWGKDGVVL